MAPSSGGHCPAELDWIRQSRVMNRHLQEHSCVSPFLTRSKRPRFLIAGDQGPILFPLICYEGASQIQWEAALRTCQAILAALHTRNLHQDRCLKSWFLWACLHGVPVSNCWNSGCAFGLPVLSEKEWSSADHKKAEKVPLQVSPQENSGKLPVGLPSFARDEAATVGMQSLVLSSSENNRVSKGSLQGALLNFGMPSVKDQAHQQPSQDDTSTWMQKAMQVDSEKHADSDFASCQVRRSEEAQAAPNQVGHSDSVSAFRVRSTSCGINASLDTSASTTSVSCGDALVPFMYAAMARLQFCFAYLNGMRVGEAAHPGPRSEVPNHQVGHDPSSGVRIGEAKNPGPGPLGPELESMIKQYVMEAVREAIKEAFQNLGLSAPAATVQTADKSQGGPQVTNTTKDTLGKNTPKGKGKPPKPPPSDKIKGKGNEGSAAKSQVSISPDPTLAPSSSATPNKRGKGRGLATDNEWKLVTRQPKSGDFQLRAQDWNAPVISFGKLSAAIDANTTGSVLEGVILAEKQEVEHAKLMLQGSKVLYKFLLIYLAKDETSQKIPGRVQDQLCFRDAVVLQCHSSSVTNSPTPAGLASAPIKVAPLQSVAVYVRVPRQYASDQTWASFCKHASKTAATWAAHRHVQPLDSFNWAEEKQRTGGQELQVFGIMRVPKKDLSSLLAVSGQQGVFIEPCRSQAPRIKITWIERIKGESAAQYLTRANQHGAAFGLAVHGGRLGWRLAAQPDELLPRVWTLPWLPVHWDDDAVKQLLSSEFKDIELLTHRRSRGQLSYRFRATCLKGDKDLVALLAETDTGPLTLWASVAPARTLQKSQRKLPQGAVPVIAPRQHSMAFPTTSKAVSEAEVGVDGKPVPGAKRTKCDVRTVPSELQTIDIAKDGNCVYRAIAEGLAWLSAGKLKVEHRELRAKAIAHLQKHKEAYSAQWDKESPSGDPMQSFDDYLAASAQNCAYGSPLEVEALARVYDVQIILIPCIADFAIMSFRSTQAKRILVLWYHDKHIDLLLPKNDLKKYPDAVVNITKGPVSKLRAGGPCSTSSRTSKAASVWTVGARSSVSLIKSAAGKTVNVSADTAHLDTYSVWSRVPSDASLQKLVSRVSDRGAKPVQTSSSSWGRGSVEKVVFSGRSNRIGDALPTSPPPPQSTCANLPTFGGVPDKPRASCKRKLTKTDSDGSQDLSGCHEVPQTKRIYKAAELKMPTLSI